MYTPHQLDSSANRFRIAADVLKAFNTPLTPPATGLLNSVTSASDQGEE